GGEAGYKMTRYAKTGVPYYVIYDPKRWLKGEELQSLELRRGAYRPLAKPWFPDVNLGLKRWDGRYADLTDNWLRWSDSRGRQISTGSEVAERERRERERLAAKLRELGYEP